MTDLFSLTDLAVWSGSALNGDLAELARTVVTGLVEAEIGSIPDPVPAGLSAVALMVAARLYDNPLGYKAESFAGWSGTYGDAELTATERRALRRAVGASNGLALSVQLDY